MARCEGCPFRTGIVEGDIRPASLLVVGEAPAKNELREGRPFVGKSGKLLWEVLQRFGFSREDCAVTNALCCHIPDYLYTKKASILKEPIASCRGRLLAEIEIVRPRLILALGNVALHALTGDHGLKITHERGDLKSFTLPLEYSNGHGPFQTYLLATLHPAAVLRNVHDLKKMAVDCSYACQVANGGQLKNPGPTKFRVIRPGQWGIAQWYLDLARKKQGQGPLVLGADIETNNLDPLRGSILALGISQREGFTLIFPHETINDPATRKWLRAIFADQSYSWVWHNGKFDTKYLKHEGFPARVDHDTILLHYCLAPGTKVLKRDMTWENIENLEAGDDLVGFDEKDIALMEPSTVLATKRQTAPCYKITTTHGSVIASENHLWPIRLNGHNYRKWVSTKELAGMMDKPQKLPFFAEPWEVDESHEAGYIAGILDGEGCLNSGWNGNGTMSNHVLQFSQKEGIVLDRMKTALAEREFEIREYPRPASGVTVCHIAGYRESLRAIGTFRPARFLERTDEMWVGRRKHHVVQITAIEYLGEREVIGIKTTTNTLIANGFLSHNCLDEQKGTHDLKQLSTHLLGAGDYGGIFKKFLAPGASFAAAPRNALFTYLSKDADYTRRLFYLLSEKVRAEPELEKLYREILLPLTPFLQRVEMNGMPLSIEATKALEGDLTIERDSILRAIHALSRPFWDEVDYKIETGAKTAEENFNPGSPLQLAWILFKSMRLRAHNGRQDTQEDTLKSIPNNPFVDEILKYRKITKQLGTYVTGMQRSIGTDGRIHTTFKIPGTTTGRLSSAEPNLQNIPRNRLIKDIFQAEEGRCMIELDLDQAEIRMLAHLSSDPTLIQVFADKRDVHSETALKVFGPEFTSEHRTASKSVNFGIMYGLTEFGLVEGLASQGITISFNFASRMIEGWRQTYPTAWSWLLGERQKPMQGKYVASAFGRRRRFPLVTRDSMDAIQNEASNHAIQSSASDLNLIYAMHLEPRLPDLDSHIINLVHDSVLIDAPDDLTTIREVVRRAKDSLSWASRNRLQAKFDFTSSAKMGTAWGSLAKYVDTETELSINVGVSEKAA